MPDPEHTEIVGTKIRNEVPPNQGVQITSADYKDIKDGQTLYVLSKEPNKVTAFDTAFKVKKSPSGEITLTPIKNDLGPEERRAELAKMIVEANKDQIMQQALKVTEEALMRKPVTKLERMANETKNGKQVKTKTGPGCVFLSIGEEEVIL